MSNYHSIGGREFYVPDEISYRQYYAINELLKSVKLDPMALASVKDNGGDTNVKINGTMIYSALMSEGKLPEFFAILLIPKNELIWKAEYQKDNAETMYDVGDKKMLEVLQDFLNGRVDLIESILGFLTPLLKNSKRYTESLNEGTQKELPS